MTRVLVCGGRDFLDQKFLNSELDRLHARHQFSCLIEGEQRGADIMARTWAIWRAVLYRPFPAMWGVGGQNAGPTRNRQMIVEGLPDLIVAFDTGGPGTSNMLKQARKAGFVPVVFNCRAGAHA